MTAAPLLPRLNWAARPANVCRVVGSAVRVADSVCVAFCEPSDGKVLLLLLLPPVDAEPLPAKEADADADAKERVGLYVMAVVLEDPTASTVWLAAVEEAETVRLPVLEEKGQWKGIEDAVEDIDDVGAALPGSDEKGQWDGMEDEVDGIEDVAAALSGSDEKGQWNGMDDAVPVPDEVGPGPWKGAEDG